MRKWVYDSSGSLALRLLLVATCGCVASESVHLHSEFRLGMSKEAVVTRFGPPDSERVLIKDSPAIWGPIEDFWPQVPPGAKVEIWSYRSRAALEEGSSRLTEGLSELYFVGGAESVAGMGFAPEGVVYEGGPT